MWFKNLAILHLDTPLQMESGDLSDALESFRFRGCGKLDAISFGWTPPVNSDDASLLHEVGGYRLMKLKKQEKILPSSVINESLEEKISQIETEEGRTVRRKEREMLKDETIHQLLPQAFCRSRTISGYLDPTGSWLLVDSVSSRVTEDFVAMLRKSVGSLPVKPISVVLDPSAMMTDWVSTGVTPPSILLEQECELRSVDDEGAVIRCKRHDLNVPEIINHIEAGKLVIQLALTWNERISFLLDENLSIKRLRFLENVIAESDVDASDDPHLVFDSNFTIMTLELSAFLDDMITIFGGIKSRENSH